MAMTKLKTEEANTIKLGSKEYVVLPKKEFESMKDSLEILNSKEIMDQVKKSEEEFKKGEFKTFTVDDFRKRMESQ